MPTAQALEAYHSILAALNELDMIFSQNDEKLSAKIGFSTDDLDVNITLFVDSDRSLIRAISLLPFKFSEKKRLEGAVATSAINDKLVMGCFSYNLQEGCTFFHMENRFYPENLRGFRTDHLRPANIDAVKYLIGVSVDTIAAYDALLLNLASGNMTINDFLDKINK